MLSYGLGRDEARHVKREEPVFLTGLHTYTKYIIGTYNYKVLLVKNGTEPRPAYPRRHHRE